MYLFEHRFYFYHPCDFLHAGHGIFLSLAMHSIQKIVPHDLHGYGVNSSVDMSLSPVYVPLLRTLVSFLQQEWQVLILMILLIYIKWRAIFINTFIFFSGIKLKKII